MKAADDYNWDTYTHDFYEQQVFDSIKTDDGMDLLVTKYDRDENNHIRFFDNLHPNWKELYHLVDVLGVDSVYEVGCGSGQHLINLRTLNQNIKLAGVDYAQSQIDVGIRRLNLSNYDFLKDLRVMDMTIDIDTPVEKYELVYTQAVVMHLAHPRAKKMLINMSKLSSRYIVMIENIQNHNFPALIAEAIPEFEIIDILKDEDNNILNKKYINNTILLQRKVGE